MSDTDNITLQAEKVERIERLVNSSMDDDKVLAHIIRVLFPKMTMGEWMDLENRELEADKPIDLEDILAEEG